MKHFPDFSHDLKLFVVAFTPEELIELSRFLSSCGYLPPVLRDLSFFISNFTFDPLDWSVVEVLDDD